MVYAGRELEWRRTDSKHNSAVSEKETPNSTTAFKEETASCKRLISWFLLDKGTELGHKIVPVRPPNKQNQYLNGLISVVPVQRRRNGKDDRVASNHVSSYCYRVRARIDNDILQDVTVCHKAFLSLHGVTNRRIQTLKKQLIEFGEAQLDGRGKHKNRPNRLPEETKARVFNFIKSLKGRKSY
ncbi:uncharacterized protein TNCV_685621 [Trichonephila clavipes]|nr:uncharacterized protein TNCV_685621 [Trichonephila clavipes]